MTLIGDILVKVALEKVLTNDEREKLRLYGNELETSRRTANVFITNPPGGGKGNMRAIILHDVSAEAFAFYTVDRDGLKSALEDSENGDIVWIPAATIPLESAGFGVGPELATGSITVTSETGATVGSLTPGMLYAIDSTGGYWDNGTGTRQYDFAISDDGTTWVSSISGILESVVLIGDHYRFFFKPTGTSIKVRVADGAGLFGDNTGSLGYSLKSAYYSVTVPSGVEVVGTGENSVLDGTIVNSGILTNLKVTGTVIGGDVRMVSNTAVQLFSRQIQSLVASGTAPLIIASPTLVTNLNADTVDGYHYAPLVIKEIDGTPTGSPGTIKFPNGSLTDNGDGSFTFAPAGSGDVVGPASAVDNNIVVFDSTTGKLIKDSGVAVGTAINPLIAYNAYAGGDYTSLTSASLADVDATNMAVTFTAPASGNVMIDLIASASSGNGTVGQNLTWGLRESTTDIVVGEVVIRCTVTAASTVTGVCKTFLMTGISAGSHTYKWSYKQSAGTGTIYANSGSPAVMRVWALP